MPASTPSSSFRKVLKSNTSLTAGLILILLSSCLPKAVDQAPEQNSQRRKSTAGDRAGASMDDQLNGPNNSSTNPMTDNNSIIIGSGNGSAAGNSGVNNNSGSNNMAPIASDCHKGDPFVCKVERLIGEKTNKYREGRGLQALALDAKIAFVSRDWSAKMARSGYISHSGFPSSRVSVYRQEFNTSRSLRGENVAMTGRVSGSSQDDAAAERIANEFATMWWNSSGHRANMLGRFKSLGVGVHKTSRGSWYATQIFE